MAILNHHHESGTTILTVLEKSPRRVMKTSFQSSTKDSSHIMEPIVRFHSMMTTPGASSFSSQFLINFERLQMAFAKIQRNKAILKLRLNLLREGEYHYRTYLRTKVMYPTQMKRMMKNITAPGPWMEVVPLPSIVAIAQQKPIMEACATGKTHPSIVNGNWVYLIRSLVHLNITKQMMLMKLPAPRKKNLNSMSWGKWQAVAVMVAWGKGFSCFCLTAMWQEQRQPRMREGRKTQRMQLMWIPPKRDGCFFCWNLLMSI